MISNLNKRKIYTLLKVQYSNMLEYRVEIALWAISGIIPFFMLNIWTNNNLNESINISDVMLSRYFLCAFFVRQFSVVWVVFSFEEDSIKLGNSGFYVKNKTKNEITIKVENNSITSSLKFILNNFDIEDLYINEPPVDEIIGKILIKKDYDL